jgi:hypothetical protein
MVHQLGEDGSAIVHAPLFPAANCALRREKGPMSSKRKKLQSPLNSVMTIHYAEIQSLQPDSCDFVSMGFDIKAFEGKHIAVGVSRESGNSWRWTMLSKKRFDDRPWIAVEPDGAAHVIWNDGSGVYHSVSRDRGATWSPAQVIHPQGGSGHLAVGPKGELAVRITPASASGNKIEPEVELVAISGDGGNTWEKHSVPGQRIWAWVRDL